MRKSIIGALAIAMLLVVGLVAPGLASQPSGIHCPGHNSNDVEKFEVPGDIGQDEANDLVLPEGTVFCVKSGQSDDEMHTDKLTADGVTSLRDYLKAANIVGGDGEGRDVSYYVVYEEPVDPCDPADRPAGMSIAQWHESIKFTGTCVDFDYEVECGSVDAWVSVNETGLFYEVVASIGAPEWNGHPVPNSTNDFPIEFDEGEHDGEATVYLWLEGAEADFLAGSGIANFWDRNAHAVTVDTNCEEPTNGNGEEPEEPREEPTEEPTEEPVEEEPTEEAPEEEPEEEDEDEEEPVREVERAEAVEAEPDFTG